MKLHKCMRMALNMVLHSKLRSWLTILGIVIGVASVIAIVAIGNGLTSEINSQMGDLEGDIITLTAGYSKAQTMGPGRNKDGGSSSTASDDELTNKDVQALKGISEIDVFNTKISGSVEIYYLGESGTVSLTGTDESVYSEMATTDILSGRELGSSDTNVVLIGNKLATEFFEKELGINKMITIESRSYRIVGILDDESNSIIMPLDAAYEVLEDSEKFVYDTISIRVKDADVIDDVVDKIETKLMRVRHVDEDDKDFTLRTNAAVNEMKAEMLSTMTLFLTAIASVSLLVGAVGIANTMFTSVLEKTKEIGIMKAIGARNFDILIIFLFNAGLIGFVGGMIGVIFGYLIAKLLAMVGMVTLVDSTTVIVVLVISIGIGMISGIIPAVNASKLRPVDALRSD